MANVIFHARKVSQNILNKENEMFSHVPSLDKLNKMSNAAKKGFQSTLVCIKSDQYAVCMNKR